MKKRVIQKEDKSNGVNLLMFITIHLSVFSEFSRKIDDDDDDDFIVACRSSQETYPHICIYLYLYTDTERFFPLFCFLKL